jgi:GTP-binding protein YchF
MRPARRCATSSTSTRGTDPVQVTIVGLPGSGKTTVFNALTGGHAETGGYSGGRAAPNISVVKVPDEQVDRLAALFSPKKTTYADVTYVDVAIPAGAAREGTVNPDVLAQVRNADALLHVARAFDDAATSDAADPWRDVDDLDLEFTVADLSVIEKRLEKLKTQGRHGSQAERELAQREEELLGRIEPHLSEGRPIRSFGLTQDEELLLRGYRFLTQKPVLVVLNIDEGRLAEAASLEEAGRARYGQPQTDVAALAGKIEAEIGELPDEDARLFMDDLGISEPSRGRVIRLTYELLGLFSFYTAGDDECRAWTIRRGASAVEAAGTIHSDLARGFIRAEVITVGDLLEAGSMAEARKRGTLRQEGKAYEVRENDVLQILFNVGR